MVEELAQMEQQINHINCFQNLEQSNYPKYFQQNQKNLSIVDLMNLKTLTYNFRQSEIKQEEMEEQGMKIELNNLDTDQNKRNKNEVSGNQSPYKEQNKLLIHKKIKKIKGFQKFHLTNFKNKTEDVSLHNKCMELSVLVQSLQGVIVNLWKDLYELMDKKLSTIRPN